MSSQLGVASEHRRRRSQTASKPAIVVGIDGSDNGLRALDWAVLEAERRGLHVRLVHAYRRLGLRYHVDPQSYMREMYEEGRAVFAAARDHLGRRSGRVVGTALHEGTPSRVLEDACIHSPMCVVGRRGRGRLASRALGSTSTTLAATSRVPLIVVPPEWRATRDPSAAGLRVVLAVDDPHCTVAVVEFGFEAAAVAGVPLDVLCTRTPAIDRASLEPWQARFPNVPVSVLPRTDQPGRTLTEQASTAHLVVVPGPVLRADCLSHVVVRQSTAPVAVVPTHPPGTSASRGSVSSWFGARVA
ncbi:MAG TPA: universal stress protein [Actinopolymorphaceae bacterium]|jgi:nucleotide-binding universal stress UspA family protein